MSHEIVLINIKVQQSPKRSDQTEATHGKVTERKKDGERER